MPRGRLLRAAAAASMVSSARTNRAVRKGIEQQNEENSQIQPAQTQQATAKDDLTTQLEQLNELRNKGILTQEEFDAKKKQILGI